MSHSLKLALSSILITLIVLGLSSPVRAQPTPPPPIIFVDAPSSVNVSTEFDIIIWIRDIPPGWMMTYFDLNAEWDPDDLEYIESELLTSWQGVGNIVNQQRWYGTSSDPSGWTEDAAWFRIRFHCLRGGAAQITVSSPSGQTVQLKDLSGGFAPVNPEPVTVTVNQVAPVGGIVTPVDKLEILTPYLALAGLIAVVSAVYVMRRRKD
jgi:hypothetical protein